MSERLSEWQQALLERVCLRRYTVEFWHYMGSHQPYESITIDEGTGTRDRSFRPATAEALRSRGLVHYASRGQGFSHVKPTRAGLDLYRASRATKAVR